MYYLAIGKFFDSIIENSEGPLMFAKSTNPYLENNYAPVSATFDTADLTCEGVIPADLNGLMVRNGPNPTQRVNPKRHHWFLGDGMLHGVKFAEGKAVSYRNRSVSAGGSTPNTHVIGHGGRIVALVEAGGAPVEVDHELNSLDRPAFEGSLRRGFTAHTKLDSVDGALHAVCYDFKRGYQLSYLAVGADNRLQTHQDISLSTKPMVHDCAITKRFVLIFDLSVTFSLNRLIRRYFPFAWNDRHQARIGLLNRQDPSQPIQWFEIAPCYIFHALNAYENNSGEVILDAMRYERLFDTVKIGPFGESSPFLTRWCLNPNTGSVTETQLDDHAAEFPRVHPQLEGQPTQFGYALGIGDDPSSPDFNTIVKYHQDGSAEIHTLGQYEMASEPIFVAKSGSVREDEGYLLSYVFDQREGTSHVIILDAQDLSAKPIARVMLPQRVPFGFHGSWIGEPSP